MGEPVASFGHAGYGGAIVYADFDRRLAVGLTKNLFNNYDNRSLIMRELNKVFAPMGNGA